jgi:replicative DNA helicase
MSAEFENKMLQLLQDKDRTNFEKLELMKHVLLQEEVNHQLEPKVTSAFESVQQLLKRLANPSEMSLAIPIGFNTIDDVIGGVRLGEFIIIGGRAGMEKSIYN